MLSTISGGNFISDLIGSIVVGAGIEIEIETEEIEIDIDRIYALL